MKKIFIIGAGSHGRTILGFLKTKKNIFFIDNKIDNINKKIIGNDNFFFKEMKKKN